MTRLRRATLIAVMMLYVIMAYGLSQATPFNKGPDEGSNLNHIGFIATKGRLAISYEERAQIGHGANQPALYHLFLAWLSRILGIRFDQPPVIKIFWDSFRYRAMDIQEKDDSTWYLLTEDQAWPYYGRILALHVGRWFSIILNGLTLLLTYRLALEIFPHKPWPALTALALLAFIPTFTFMSSVLNEDALIAVLAALYFLILVRAIKNPRPVRLYIGLGLILGLSVTVKYTTVLLPLELLGILAIIAWRHGYSWLWWLQRVAISGCCALAASSWWFGWNLWFLNDIKTSGWLAGILRPFFTGGTDRTLARLGYILSDGQVGAAGIVEGQELGTLWGWIRKTFLSFWGVSIGEQGIPLAAYYVYSLVGLLIVAVILGLWRTWRSEASARSWLVLMIFHIALFTILPFLRFWMSRRLGETAQGRHILIPSATAVAVLMVWGLAKTIPPRWHAWVFPMIILSFMGWTGAHLQRLAYFGPPLLPLRTLPEAATWLPHPVNVVFGDLIELVSYDLRLDLEQGVLRLELAWRALAYANENYQIKLDLLDNQAKVVSHWQGYNGHGRVPTLAWDSGDSIFDRLALPLPNLPAGNYQLQVQVLGRTGPLLLNHETDRPAALSLTQIALEQPSSFSFPYRAHIAGSDLDFALWQPAGPIDSQQPSYSRYPATISIITSALNAPLEVKLVDPGGQTWSPDRSEANIYTFIIAPGWRSGAYQVQLSAQGDRQSPAEPLLLVENWWERRFAVSDIETPMQANFANEIKLLGYKLSQPQVKAGEAFPITLYWQAPMHRSPQANFIQFNHLLDAAGTLRGGYDRRPLEYYSTLLWAPAEIVVDGYTVPVHADAPPGDYYLNVGYYLTVGESAVNLPLVVDGKITENNFVTIGPIEVVAQ